MHELETNFIKATSRVVKQICERLGYTCEVDGYDIEYNGTMATLATFLADYSANFTSDNTLDVFNAGQDVATFLLGKTATFNPISFLVTSEFGTVSIWHMLACFDSPNYTLVALDFAKYKANGGAYRIEYFYHILQKTN